MISGSADLGAPPDLANACPESSAPNLFALRSTTGGAGAWVGLLASGLDASLAGNVVTFGGITAPVLYREVNPSGSSEAILYARVPAATPTGNALVTLATCAGTAAGSPTFVNPGGATATTAQIEADGGQAGLGNAFPLLFQFQ